MHHEPPRLHLWPKGIYLGRPGDREPLLGLSVRPGLCWRQRAKWGSENLIFASWNCLTASEQHLLAAIFSTFAIWMECTWAQRCVPCLSSTGWGHLQWSGLSTPGTCGCHWGSHSTARGQSSSLEGEIFQAPVHNRRFLHLLQLRHKVPKVGHDCMGRRKDVQPVEAQCVALGGGEPAPYHLEAFKAFSPRSPLYHRKIIH